MDELGSSIRHSQSNANVCCVSFFFEPTQTMFTLLYPIVRIEQPYTEIFRTYVYGNSPSLDLAIKLLPWQRVHQRKNFLRKLTIEQYPDVFGKKMQDNTEIFEESHKNDLYDLTPAVIANEAIDIDPNSSWKVYTDQESIKQYLTDANFQLIDNADQANILFQTKVIQDFRHETLKTTLINQYPLESIVTNIELLSFVLRQWKSIGEG